MVIEKKWVVIENRTGGYFQGFGENNHPVIEPISSKTKQYKSERSAKAAINCIGSREYCDFCAKYIERLEVPDAPETPESQERPTSAENGGLVEVQDTSGWIPIFMGASPPNAARRDYWFSKIALCFKRIGEKEVYGVQASDGKLYSAGIDGGEVALNLFLEEYRKYLLPRVTRK